jgi:hypothetical protein
MNPRNEFSDHRSEAGETLIEVLLSSALMALVVVAILGGVATMVLGSDIHRDQTEANPALVSAMEDLKSPATPRRCPIGSAVLPAYTHTLPSGVTISKIEYQKVPTTGSGYTWSTATSDCDDRILNTSTPDPDDTVESSTGSPDPDHPLTLQRITLKYTHPGGNVAPELQFVKGDH